MVTFASALELSDFVGHPVDTARGDMLVNLASTAVLEAAGVDTLEETTETVTVDGTGTPVVLLPSFPVTAVTSVTVDGEVVDPDGYHWSRSGVLELAYGWQKSPIVVPGMWPRRRRSVTVTYTHGYPATDVPEALRTACLVVAARLEMNPQGLRDFQGADVTSRFGDGGVRLTREERAMVVRALR